MDPTQRERNKREKHLVMDYHKHNIGKLFSMPSFREFDLWHVDEELSLTYLSRQINPQV